MSLLLIRISKIILITLDRDCNHEIWLKIYTYSCEMRMSGTDKCRLTLLVHFDSINISNWTDYKILLQREIDPMLF